MKAVAAVAGTFGTHFPSKTFQVCYKLDNAHVFREIECRHKICFMLIISYSIFNSSLVLEEYKKVAIIINFFLEYRVLWCQSRYKI